MSTLAVSYAEANQELVNSFLRYLQSRGMSKETVRKYQESCQRLCSAADASRSDVRVFLSDLLKNGVTDNSVVCTRRRFGRSISS